MIGNVIEWYDFGLYGYMAVLISELFFPHADKTVSLIATYGVFAAGFLMRPLGAIFFGHLGDTVGRKRVMILSVAMMVIPTLLVGVLPTYADWGLAAPLALVAIRLAQGFSVGGEFSGSVTYLVETAPPTRRGLAGSWANVGCVAGMILGAATPATVLWILGEAATHDWGWRLPFLFGGIIGIAAFVLRRGLPEAASAVAERAPGDHPIKRVFREEGHVMWRVMLFTCSYGIAYYIPIVYLPTWLSLYAGFRLHEALYIATLCMTLQLVLVPWAAHLSDTVIRRTHLLALVFVAMALAALPLFLLAESGTLVVVVLLFAFFSALLAVPLGVVPTTLAEAFDRGHRLTGYSLSFNLGLGVAGGTAPMLATGMIAVSGTTLAPAVYLAAAGLVGTLGLVMLRDRSREPLR